MSRVEKGPGTDSVLHSNEVAGTRLELLLFTTSDSQIFGINVFKVQEIIPYRRLTQVPGSHHLVRGVANLRGRNMPVIDLANAIGKMPYSDLENTNIIVSEHNRSVHGFLVGRVDRIVHTNWEQVLQPPKGLGRHTYVTSIARLPDLTVAILDVERVLDEVVHSSTHVSEEITTGGNASGKRILVVDDSSVARNQIRRALEQINIECDICVDGHEACNLMQDLITRGVDLAEHYAMMISDIEMPKMDGYQLTSAVRAMPQGQSLYILLHSSISGAFNHDMVAKTGANRFIQKYDPDDLATAVLDHIAKNQPAG